LISAQGPLANPSALAATGRAYSASWRGHFVGRIRAASAFAHMLMRPRSAALAVTLPKRFPAVLTFCAGLSGKTKQVPLAAPPRA
jgi:hypothetical protein